MFPNNAEGRAAVVAGLARRAYPTYEFFIFALLSGAVLGLGFLLDSPAVLLFGILLAPLMVPWVGMVLAMISGSARFFIETLVSILITVLLVFLSGLLSGFASRAFGPMTFNNAFIHSQLWVAWLVVLAAGSALLVVSFVRSEEKPFLPSVMLAYSLFTPISAAGFGLGSGVDGLWPNGLLVFGVHLSLATLVGLIVFLAMRFRPTAAGYALTGVSTAAIIAALVLLMAPGSTGPKQTSLIDPTATQEVEPSPELVVAAVSTTAVPTRATLTPRVHTPTPSSISPSPVALSLVATLPASETPTITLTIEPTPVFARISSDTGGGVNLRRTPNGTYIATLDNGSIVEVLPDVQELSGTPWAHVIAVRNGVRMEGWILQSVLITATPVADWQPSATVSRTSTAIP
jgi:hypothetical protein